MKRNQFSLTIAIIAGVLAPHLVSAQTNYATNRLTFSGRFGLNISGKFTGAATIAVPPSTRTTPNGDTYNYDDGYVYADVSGSGDGYSWYWGYDNGSQINAGANTILLSRSSGTATLNSPDEDAGFSPGFELAYARELLTSGGFHLGVEGALNYLNISFGGGSSYAVTANRITDAYSYVSGTTPPGSPYQGTFDGPGFVIGTSPVSSIVNAGAAVGTVTGSRDYEGNLWGARLGPYAEYYFGESESLSVSLSGGLAIGWLDSSASWNEMVSFTGGGSTLDAGSGSDSAFLVGGYVAANLNWRLSEHWGATGGVQFQSLGQYDASFGTRRVELDLGKSFFFTVGVSYAF
jgi:hypothetical protein